MSTIPHLIRRFARIMNGAQVIVLASVFFCLTLLVGTSAARSAQGDRPSAFVAPLQPLGQVPVVVVPALDPVEIQQEDEKDFREGLAPRYAVVNPVNLNPTNAGTWERLDDRNSVWRLIAQCPNALHINLGFSRFVMPEGGRLFIYDPQGADIIRPFTSEDNAAHGELWTPPVCGTAVVIELTIPIEQIPSLQLTLGSINAGYRKFGPFESPGGSGGIDSGSCNVDVACPEADGWRLQIPAIGVISTGGSRFCTGFLVNNVRQDRKPYFMTANHCGLTSGNAASLIVFWNYENSFCRPVGSAQSGQVGDGSLGQFSTGSTFRAAFASSDFTLVELSQPPNPAWRLSWAGWDKSGAQSPNGACIHHPNTEEKRITLYNTTTDNGNCGFSGSHVRAFWSLGVTEPGSSGSPLFDANHRAIGQLHGGPSACGVAQGNLNDCFGRFSASWTGGGTSATRLSNWLDPDNTGVTSIDTLGSMLSVTPAPNVTHTGPVGGPFSNIPTIYNISNSTGMSAQYSVSIIGGATAPILINGGTSTLNGVIFSGGNLNFTVTLASSANSLPAGIYSATIRIQDTTNGFETFRTHTLEVGQVGFGVSPQTALNGSGPVGGPFSPAGGQVYTITSTSPTPTWVRVAAGASWIAINGGSPNTPVDVFLNGVGANANVTIGFTSVANTVGAGLYSSSATFTNITGGGTGSGSDTSRAVTLEVGGYVYNSSEPPIFIPDFNTVGITSTITVPDGYCVGDVDVTVDVSHTWVGDLKFVLRHNNIPVAFIDRPGVPASTFGCDMPNFVNVVIDDEGTGGPIESQCQPDLTSPPNFTPNQALAAFDGGSVSGSWSLTVTDNANQDVGTLNSWSLKITPLPNTCPPVANDVTVTVPTIVTSNITLIGSSSVGNPSYVITSLPGHGNLFEPNGAWIASAPHTMLNHGNVVRYRPESTFAGSDSFTFKLNDGQDSNTATVSITVGGPQLVTTFALDSNPGWATTGLWAFGQPQGLGGDPPSGYTGANVYGYNLNGPYSNNMPEYPLTSTAINCLSLTSVQVKFRRWLGVEQAVYDHARFQVSTNGTSWTTIWENPAGTGQSIVETAWSLQSYSVPQADGQATVYLRWTMGPTDGSVTYSGWNLDDIQIWGIRPPCLADITGDRLVNVSDLFAVLYSWGSCPNCPADIAPPGGNGLVNVSDLLAVINGWGICP